MRIEVHQEFSALSAAAVARAYADPELYPAMVDLPFVGTPELVSHGSDGPAVQLAVRYRVEVSLPAAARVFVDTSRLTFVEHVRLAADGDGTFEVAPDHYARMLRFAGTYRIDDRPDGGARRTVSGDLRVDLGWKGKLVEGDVTRLIGQGLTDALHAQVPLVERHLS